MSIKVYTKAGDHGQTSLVGGKRVAKSDERLETYGTVDELNSVIGVLVSVIQRDVTQKEVSDLVALLQDIQNDLFNVGSQLACEDENVRAKLPSVSEEKIVTLEKTMDAYTTHLKPLRNFILPGGT